MPVDEFYCSRLAPILWRGKLVLDPLQLTGGHIARRILHSEYGWHPRRYAGFELPCHALFAESSQTLHWARCRFVSSFNELVSLFVHKYSSSQHTWQSSGLSSARRVQGSLNKKRVNFDFMTLMICFILFLIVDFYILIYFYSSLNQLLAFRIRRCFSVPLLPCCVTWSQHSSLPTGWQQSMTCCEVLS